MLKKGYLIFSILVLFIGVLEINSQEPKEKGMEEMWGEAKVSGDA